jgi:hypothetical protein
MNFANILYETKNGRRRLKPRMLMLGIVSAFLIFVYLISVTQRRSAQNQFGPGPFVTQQAPPPRSLDYQIVKVDTIPFSSLNMPAERTGSPTSQNPLKPTAEGGGRTAAREQANASPSSSTQGSGIGGSSPMIVVSTLDQQGQAGGSLSALPGAQTVRIKVILPQKTPVMNGSLVEARVMRDERLGKFEIPRRSQLLGFCTLQNNRVQIEFRELRIKDVSHTCSGRAYDLKLLPGIPYLPLDAKAKQAIVDELKSAASGVPVLGRYLNQQEINPFTDEITTLEEGLEFYALVSSIF